jgi:ABC-2 type transport system ATP-binding protein
MTDTPDRTSSNEQTADPPLIVSELTVTLSQNRILEDVNLRLDAGHLLWLVGQNGAGKSTLMRAIVGLLPFGGEILVGGAEPRSIRARGSFVYVPDEPALYEDLTLREHAKFNALTYGQPEAETRTLEFLERFRLEDRLDEFPANHSRGMRQKLSLSLALGLELPLLILDEPYNGLDTQAQDDLSAALQDRLNAGRSVLVCAHQGTVGQALVANNRHARVGTLYGGHYTDDDSGVADLEKAEKAEALAANAS